MLKLETRDAGTKLVGRERCMDGSETGFQELLIGFRESYGVSKGNDFFVHVGQVLETCGVFRILDGMVDELLAWRNTM